MPKLTLTYLLILVLLRACDMKKEVAVDKKADDMKSYSVLVSKNFDKKPKNDSIALGFHLRQPAASVEKHFKELVETKKLGEKTDWNLGFTIVPGVYPYKLYLSDTTSVEAYVTSANYNDSLITLTIFGDIPAPGKQFDYDNVISFMRNRFGPEQTIEKDDDEISYKYHWFDGYKNIVLARTRNLFFAIEYRDLFADSARKKLLTDVNSVLKENEKEKIKDAKTDIK